MRHTSRIVRTLVLVVLMVFFVLAPSASQVMAATCSPQLSQLDCQALTNDWTDWVPLTGNCGTTSTSGTGTSSLNNYTLPAGSGRSGDEQAIDANGNVINPPGGRVTFWQFAKLGQAYRDYYITMRWNYVSWNWDGTSVGPVDTAQLNWMGQAPRKVLVTNPRTQKSIVAVALESGPAPWTGVDHQGNNVPKQGWVNPQKGTPSAYTGRVSGFPPTARNYLGYTQGMTDGSGDVLNYGWAPDQNATPGPTNLTASGSGSSSNCGTGGDPSTCKPPVTSDGYSFPIQLCKNRVAHNGHPDNPPTQWPCIPLCHHDGTPAADLTDKDVEAGIAPDSKVVGTPELAIASGHVQFLFEPDPANAAGCWALQYVDDVHDASGPNHWHYYYDHFEHPTVQIGQKVTVGQRVAVVGRRACTRNGSYPHLHIDRGSPQGYTAGYVCCRDPGFITILNRLYTTLP